MSHKDFAKIVIASNGQQVLFYVEPYGGEYNLHQVASHDGYQADMKLEFVSDDADENERLAYAALQNIDTQHADLIVKQTAGFLAEQS